MSSPSGPLPPPTPEGPLTPNEQSLKRALEAAIAENNALKQNPKMRRIGTTKDCSYIHCIRKLASLYVGIRALINDWDLYQLESQDPNLAKLRETDTPGQKRSHDRNVESFKILWALLSSTEYRDLLEDSETMVARMKALELKADGARGDDIGKLKPEIANWLNDETIAAAADGLVDPKLLVSPMDKACRGFQHPVTGRLLCSIIYDWDDPEVRKKIQDADPNYPRYVNYFVRAFYDPKLIDPTNVEQGFLMSPLLVKVFQFIFTSPHSVLATENIENQEPTFSTPRKGKSKGRPPTRKCVSNLIGMTSVTVRSIAYACVQLHFTLNVLDSYNHEGDGFSYAGLWDTIIDYFEDGTKDEEEVKALYKWWNHRIFPLHGQASNGSKNIAASKSTLEEQRKARALAALTAANGTPPSQTPAPFNAS
ncbi:hypothetical protein VNI00_019202 [Paramarasmius palmivorus]|uniref:Uncharacterized protein n=1 Tax=Paramarasmius palmivorus TaxID=297713 RepID=A0AAW0ASS5_9AGAR